jgi:ubiquinone/menaquinone biosynthesis C-methylase UbiE
MGADDFNGWSGWRGRLYALLHRNPASNRAVVEWANLQPDMSALDVGSGTGAAVITAAPVLSQGMVVGVDPSADFVQIARRRARHLTNVGFEIAAAENLPFEANSFDIVWSVHSSHHWHDFGTGSGEAQRVLRPAGQLLIVERHDPDRPWGITTDQAHALADALAAAGFVEVAVEERPVGRGREFLIRGTAPGRSEPRSIVRPSRESDVWES